ncbi:hypothetical protein [Methylophaga sulfidovorans]|uniref:Uncharacterized protein n=1 Tax=Methylophaga sulfidovorans TaxID=45496 RepID=A0A1I3W762_9GAMM|nr:hypothetical protein [Methylophaga sulfidovorans]SFK03428.1 hypothetical protein SAMN04488079_10470 [Methylophaga sulfidovorans]
MRADIKLMHPLLKISISMLFMLLLMGCDNANSPAPNSPKQHKATELSSKNINEYANEMANSYISIQEQLLKHYQQAKQSNNTYDFIQYRNHKWTPEYMSMKTRYSRDFEHNKAFLEKQPSAPLFAIYENLIYIGLDLKNGLLEDDEARQKTALEEAEKDKQQVVNIQQQLK